MGKTRVAWGAPQGGSADVGAFKNCFGDANCFVRRTSFDAIGGYTTDYGIGFEDWEMYANASLRGFKVRLRASLYALYPHLPASAMLHQSTLSMSTSRVLWVHRWISCPRLCIATASRRAACRR
jgi:hypothetical protein